MQTYSVDLYLDIIRKYTLKLNLEWFQKKEVAFKKDKLYNKETNLIQYSTLPSSNTTQHDSIFSIDFRRYCSCYLPIGESTGWGNHESWNHNTGKTQLENIRQVSVALIAELNDLTSPLADICTISKYVAKTNNSISEEVKINRESFPENGLYSCVLDDFLKACNDELCKKYHRELTLNTLTWNYIETLDFNLTQEELVSLLYLLATAEIVGISPFDSRFISYSVKHFRFKKKGAFVKPVSERIFNNAYRRILRHENGNGLLKIKEKLQRALSQI